MHALAKDYCIYDSLQKNKIIWPEKVVRVSQGVYSTIRNYLLDDNVNLL